MNRHITAIACTGLWLLGAPALHAQPAFNASCAQSINLRTPPGGAGVYFDRDCKIAYVLPPSAGDIRVEAIARTSGLSQCATLNNFTRIFELKSQQLADLVERGMPKPDRGSRQSSPLFPAEPEQPSSGDEALSEEALRYLDELEKLQDAYVNSREKLRVFWEMPGASAQISYMVNHQALVEAYQKLNPRYGFRAISLHGAKIYLTRAIGRGDAQTAFPAVLAADIPGSRQPVHETGEVANDSGIVSGEAQSGQLMLSLFGACPYYDSNTKRMPAKLSAQELAAHMSANINYVYELQAERRYKMQYNLGMFVRRLQSSESKGGFFSTKTINKLIVEEKSEDWFDIEVEAEDGRFVFDPDFAQLMKAQAIDRAVRNIAMVVQGVPAAAPGAATPMANGASAAADELRKCPYVYCQAGGALLNVANAAFGSAQSVADYVRNHDTWVTETSQERRPLQFQGTVMFTPAQGGH